MRETVEINVDVKSHRPLKKMELGKNFYEN